MLVVEQQCLYQDTDGDDLTRESRHILGWHNDELVAHARILESDDELEPIVIGRATVNEALCGEKLGQQLMTQTLVSCAQYWPHKALYLGMQVHLQSFHTRLGFVPAVGIYDENGIPHVGMTRETRQARTGTISPGCLQLTGTSMERGNIAPFYSYESHIDDDLELLSETLEEVLRFSGDPADQKYLELKARTERALEEVRNRVSHASDDYYYRAKKAVYRADDYVYEKSWHGTGVGVTVGLVMGSLPARR